MKPTIFLEHETKTFDELEFTEQYRQSLQEYLEKRKDESLQNIFTFTSKGIKARNYVGVLKYKNHQFEILPKLLNIEKLEKEKDNNEDKISISSLVKKPTSSKIKS